MQLMFELSRRCNMQCSHCLRGDAQGKDMSNNTIRQTLLKLGNEANEVAFGGGEALINAKVLKTFVDELSWSSVWQNLSDPMWIVSNGKKLCEQENPALEYNYYSYDDEEDLHENTELVEQLMRLSNYTDVTLAISTDRWHDEGATRRFNHVADMFSMAASVKVVHHGPEEYSDLLGMGRYKGGGVSLVVSSVEEGNLLYVNINGDIFPDCNLSYTFMDEFKDSYMCLGNVHTDTKTQIEINIERFNTLCEMAGGSFKVAEGDIYELEEVTKEYDESHEYAEAR